MIRKRRSYRRVKINTKNVKTNPLPLPPPPRHQIAAVRVITKKRKERKRRGRRRRKPNVLKVNPVTVRRTSLRTCFTKNFPAVTVTGEKPRKN